MYSKVIKELEGVKYRKENLCDNYSKSDDRGACRHAEVRPLEELIEFIKELKEISENQ